MITTVIFDIGNVLAPFNWYEVYSSLFTGALLEKISALTVGDSALWNELDRGELEFEEIVQSIVKKAPELEADIRRALDEIYLRISPYDYAQRWVQGLKAAGYKVYALSNYGKVPFERSKPRFSFLPHMDGGIISYQVKKIKPDPVIFHMLCEKYRFRPEESVFIDDNASNIDAAHALGFHTVLFTDKAQADTALAALGVACKA